MLQNLAKFFRRRVRDISRFGAARQGATVVEFALIAPAFIACLLAIIQTTLYLFAQQVLQTAAVEAGRPFMTGQNQTSNVTQSQFATNVCPLVQPLFNCANLMINVQASSNFGGASASAPTLTYNANGSVANNWSYNPGSPGQVMVVQLIYQWPLFGMPLGQVLPSLGNGTTEIMGVTAFRVEPY